MYTVEYVDKEIDSLTDKLGSDYFPLVVKWGRFVSMTYDFILSNVSWIEANQEISDNIKPLVVQNFELAALVQNGKIIVPEPINYFRLISLYPLEKINNNHVKTCALCNIKKVGQEQIIDRDPFEKPTKKYPSIYRSSNFFTIDIGNEIGEYEKAIISYVKKPTFGNINNLNSIMVNLPEGSVEQIILKTANSLRLNTSEETSKDIYMFNQTFGKKSK